MFPIAAELAAYNRSWRGGDLTAAITVWAIAVPESTAYAAIAGVPAEYGLYAAAIPLLGYAIFGSSRRITVGPSAAVAALGWTVVSMARDWETVFPTRASSIGRGD